MKMSIEISNENFDFISRRCPEGTEVKDYIEELISFNIDMLKQTDKGMMDMSAVLNDLIHSDKGGKQ